MQYKQQQSVAREVSAATATEQQQTTENVTPTRLESAINDNPPSSRRRRAKDEVTNDTDEDDNDSELDRMQERLNILKQMSSMKHATRQQRSTPLQQQRQQSIAADIGEDDDNAVDLTHMFPRRTVVTSTPAHAGAPPPAQLPHSAITSGWRPSPSNFTPAMAASPLAAPTVGRRWGKPKKVKCKEQLKVCQDRLANCMRILNWQTVDGKSFSAPKFEILTQLIPTPMAASHRKQAKIIVAPAPKTPRRKQAKTTVVATQSPKTPRPKRSKAPPKRFILSTSHRK